MAFVQSESETETEQEIDQKNVRSGWMVYTNDAESNIDSSVEDKHWQIHLIDHNNITHFSFFVENVGEEGGGVTVKPQQQNWNKECC